MAEHEQGVIKQSAFISDRHRLETITAKPAANYTGALVCACVALLVYVALVALQWFDLTGYQGQ